MLLTLTVTLDLLAEMNLLVTGGAGFIGSNLIRHIIDCPGIRGLVNLDCLTYAGRLENLAGLEKNPRYCFERVDLRDKAAVREVVRRHAITHVLHLAAESHVDRSIEGPGDFIQTNIVGTFNLSGSLPGKVGPPFYHLALSPSRKAMDSSSTRTASAIGITGRASKTNAGSIEQNLWTAAGSSQSSIM